jgi:hypothetical protein
MKKGETKLQEEEDSLLPSTHTPSSPLSDFKKPVLSLLLPTFL